MVSSCLFPRCTLVLITVIIGKRPNGYWRDPLNCKQFFDELAKELGFSPSNAALWAAISYAQVTAKEVNSLLFA